MENGDFSFESISRLLAKLHKQAQKNFRDVLSAYDLSGMHAVYLHALLVNSGGLSQKQLTDRLHCDKANTSRAINDLIAKGHVNKDASADGERNMKLYLTDSGMKIANELHETMVQLKKKISDCLTDEEKENFRTIIRKISALDLNP